MSGFPNDALGDCAKMEAGIGSAVDVLVGRLHDLRADVHNLRTLKPSGTNSFSGHVKQAKHRRRQIEKQLATWDVYGRCPGSLTIDVARAYEKLDIEAELGWTVAEIESAQAAAASSKPDWWNVDVNLQPLAKVGRAAAVAAAVAAAAAAAAAGSLTSGGAGTA